VIDQELVTRKLVLITSDLRELGRIAQTPLADYLASPTHELVVERYLERVIGRMIDINYHLAVRHAGLRGGARDHARPD
jgi:hypothetical protein